MLAAVVKFTTNKRTKMGVGASPLRGRAGGCAEAPLAGPPHGPPSLTQSASEVAHSRNCCSSRQQFMHRFQDGALSGHRSGRSPSQSLWFSMRRNPLRTHRPRSSSTSGRADTPCSCMSIRVAPTCGRKCAISKTPASGKGPAPLSNGLSLVPARPSTINPQGVRYASVRPLRLRLRGDRGRPRTRRRLSSGDGPRLKTGAFRCRTISPSLRTMPSIWPVR
jgi:hypothetical protein